MNEPRTLVFLLPIWGDAYIEQFFARSLLTLLAPGNLPTLAAKHPVVIRFLTHKENFDSFRDHALFPELEKYCKVEYIDIADIIFPGNYSTTITMAYLRGMEASGENYCEDWFFYLVADYIFADGAWGNLLPLLADDKLRGITNGNFQVIEDEAWPLLEEMLTPQSTHLAIAPRTLMKLGLAHTHSIVMSSTVNQNLCHNSNANRFFWRVGSETLVGRFFLRHMLAVRPERRVEKVGASCDYSFIPEFCPSGHVHHITDSDEFALLELQPLLHERLLVEYGPWDMPKLTTVLNDWTTKEHRENASVATIYHVNDIPAAAAPIINESLAWVDNLRQKLRPTPQPSDHHPYWQGALEAANHYLRHQGAASDAHLFNLDAQNHGRRIMRFLRQFHHLLFGQMPHVHPWHPRWLECRYGIKQLMPYLNDGSKRVAFVSRVAYPFADWLRREYPERVHLTHLDRLRSKKFDTQKLGTIPYDLLFIHVNLETFGYVAKAILKLKPFMRPDADIILYLENEIYTLRNDAVLQHEFLISNNGLLNHHFMAIEQAEFGSNFHRLLRLLQQRIYGQIDLTRLRTSISYALFLVPLYTLFFASNLLYLAFTPQKLRPLSSLFIKFRIQS